MIHTSQFSRALPPLPSEYTMAPVGRDCQGMSNEKKDGSPNRALMASGYSPGRSVLEAVLSACPRRDCTSSYLQWR